jgi:hypothetical protein
MRFGPVAGSSRSPFAGACPIESIDPPGVSRSFPSHRCVDARAGAANRPGAERGHPSALVGIHHKQLGRGHRTATRSIAGMSWRR